MTITVTAITEHNGERKARQIHQWTDDHAISSALVLAAWEAEKSDVIQVAVHLSIEDKTYHVSLGHRGTPLAVEGS